MHDKTPWDCQCFSCHNNHGQGFRSALLLLSHQERHHGWNPKTRLFDASDFSEKPPKWKLLPRSLLKKANVVLQKEYPGSINKLQRAEQFLKLKEKLIQQCIYDRGSQFKDYLGIKLCPASSGGK
jgi:hypothetical protein